MLCSYKPVYGIEIQDPRGSITFKLILGAFLFGVGWGIGGLCPGPYLLTIPNSIKTAVYWGLPFFVSQKVTSMILSSNSSLSKVKNL